MDKWPDRCSELCGTVRSKSSMGVSARASGGGNLWVEDVRMPTWGMSSSGSRNNKYKRKEAGTPTGCIQGTHGDMLGRVEAKNRRHVGSPLMSWSCHNCLGGAVSRLMHRREKEALLCFVKWVFCFECWSLNLTEYRHCLLSSHCLKVHLLSPLNEPTHLIRPTTLWVGMILAPHFSLGPWGAEIEELVQDSTLTGRCNWDYSSIWPWSQCALRL